jgi:hypothetical protein
MIFEDEPLISEVDMSHLPKLKVLRQNPLVGSASPRANRVRNKVAQRVTSNWYFLGGHRGDLTSSTFIYESRSGGFLHAPSCGLASSRLGFTNRDYPRMSLETTWPGFAQGASAPIRSYGDAVALASSHPRTVTHTPLRS